MSVHNEGGLGLNELDKMLQDLRQAAPAYQSDWGGADKASVLDGALKLMHQGFVSQKAADRIGADYQKFVSGKDVIMKALNGCIESCGEASLKLEAGESAKAITASLVTNVEAVWDNITSFFPEHADRVCGTNVTTPVCPNPVIRENIKAMSQNLCNTENIKAMNQNLCNIKQSFGSETESVLKSMREDASTIGNYNFVFATAAVAGAIWNLRQALNDFRQNSANLQTHAHQLTDLRVKVDNQTNEVELIINEAKQGGSICARRIAELICRIAELHMEVMETKSEIEKIHEDLKKRRDAAATRRNGAVVTTLVNLFQTILVASQASALASVVRFGNFARNAFGVATVCSAASAGISWYDVQRLDNVLVDAQKLLVTSTLHLKLMKELTPIVKQKRLGKS